MFWRLKIVSEKKRLIFCKDRLALKKHLCKIEKRLTYLDRLKKNHTITTLNKTSIGSKSTNVFNLN